MSSDNSKWVAIKVATRRSFVESSRSHYSGCLASCEVGGLRTEFRKASRSQTRYELELEIMAEAIRSNSRLMHSKDVLVYTTNSYIVNVFESGLIDRWASNNWKCLQHAVLWQELHRVIQGLRVKFVKVDLGFVRNEKALVDKIVDSMKWR